MNIYEKIQSTSDSLNFDGALILSPVNRRYASGFRSSAGYVAAARDKTFFITDFRYYGAAAAAQKNGKISADIEILLQDGKLWENIGEIFADCQKILIEENSVTVSELEHLKEKLPGKTFVGGASEAFSKLRAVKTASELDSIMRAQSITDMAFEHIIGFISDNIGRGLTESETALELEYFMRKNGADGIAFDTIAVSGEKSAMPHGTPENIPIQKGFLTMDFGAMYDGYCSDMTRTVCIGQPNDEMKKVYETVLSAQKTALEFISAGKSGREIDFSARNVINLGGYEGMFGHSLGHSLGLEIHESPNFSPSYDGIIPAGAVVSVEPGIYIGGRFGVRIEDIVNITETGCKNLTKSSKELIIL